MYTKAVQNGHGSTKLLDFILRWCLHDVSCNTPNNLYPHTHMVGMRIDNILLVNDVRTYMCTIPIVQVLNRRSENIIQEVEGWMEVSTLFL